MRILNSVNYRILPLLASVALLSACTAEEPVASIEKSETEAVKSVAVDLSPTNWNPQVLEAYQESMTGQPLDETLAARGLTLTEDGSQGVVASTSNAFAVHAGIETLKRGGNAMDALLVTTLTQPALHMGGATSYAGQGFFMYYEAASGKVYSVSGGYATTLGETDPMSIPPYGTPSGRAVLVPGFMAGVELSHKMFASLPFESLFQPAIYVAEQGLPISPTWRMMLEQRKHVLTRLPSGREILLNEAGELPEPGTVVKQPQLAQFLKNVAAQGADYMYRGAWAEKFVAAVQEQGGTMTLADLERYQSTAVELPAVNARGYQVYGGAPLLEKIKLAELADLRSMGHYSESEDALYWLMKITRVDNVIGPHMSGSGVTPAQVAEKIPGLDVSGESRFTDAMREKLWSAMNTSAWQELEQQAEAEQVKQAASVAKLIKDFSVRKVDEEEAEKEGSRPDHSAGVVVIDSKGNMAVTVHSVTSAIFGELGVFVEGVSVVDPGAFAQAGIAKAGPGNLLGGGSGGGSSACPAVALKDGKPYFGCGNVGSSFDVVAQQGMINMIEYGMSPAEIKKQPAFFKNWPPGQPVRLMTDQPGFFSSDLLNAVNARGIDIKPTNDPAKVTSGGIWVVGSQNPDTGLKSGGVTSGWHSRVSASDAGLVEAY